jgi:hypothetical protein
VIIQRPKADLEVVRDLAEFVCEVQSYRCSVSQLVVHMSH